ASAKAISARSSSPSKPIRSAGASSRRRRKTALGDRGADASGETSNRIGAVYAAALAGWAVVSVGATLFIFALMIFETNVIGLSYLIPMMLVAAAGSLLAAIPICLVFGLPALAMVERLQL